MPDLQGNPSGSWVVRQQAPLLRQRLEQFPAVAVLGHPVAGASWEAFVIETLLCLAPPECRGWFYRTAAGAEIDLLLEWPDGQTWAIEVKRSLSPRLGKGFHQARADLQPEQTFVVIPGEGGYPLADGVEVLGLAQLAARMHGASAP